MGQILAAADGASDPEPPAGGGSRAGRAGRVLLYATRGSSAPAGGSPPWMVARAAAFTALLGVGVLTLAACSGDNERDDAAASVTEPPTPTVTLAPSISIESFLAPFDGVYTGGEPQGRQELEQLASLGVKTIISVDGSEPDAETARELGMRYVHVPIGYHGLEPGQALLIARAVRDLPGPVFFHCYHGKHRGPAAAAMAAVITGIATNEEAMAFMTRAGTSQNYQGLWECVRTASAGDAWLLDAAPAEFPEVVHPDGLVGTMAAVSRALDNLKLLRDAAWGMHPDHPDLVAANEAGRLADDMRRLTEHAFDERPANAGDDYDRMMVQSAELAQALEDLLLARDTAEAPADDALSVALTTLSRSCDECHRVYRD